MKRCLLFVSLLPVIWFGCQSGADHEMIGVPSDTVKPIRMGEAGGPSVDVRVNGKGTVVKIHGARFSCPGHRGYLGQISARRGWISVGKVTFRYDTKGIRMRGSRQWAVFKRGATPNLIVQQDGRTSRSFFRD